MRVKDKVFCLTNASDVNIVFLREKSGVNLEIVRIGQQKLKF